MVGEKEKFEQSQMWPQPFGQREAEPLMFSGLYRQRRELLGGSEVSGVKKLDFGPNSILKWL